MFRPIRVDHTKLFQVAIKTQHTSGTSDLVSTVLSSERVEVEEAGRWINSDMRFTAIRYDFFESEGIMLLRL